MKNMKLRYIYTIIILFICSLTASAQVVTAVASGEWNNPAIWSTGTVPTKTVDVEIPEGFTVTIETKADAACLNLVNNGELKYPAGANKSLTVNGGLTNNGTISFETSRTLTVKGILTNNGTIGFVANSCTIAIEGTSGVSTNNGTITLLEGNLSYIKVKGLSYVDIESFEHYIDAGGYVYLTTIDYSYYNGKTFHFGVESEYCEGFTTGNFNEPFRWPENYVAKNVLYDYYPGKLNVADNVVIPSGKTCTYADVNQLNSLEVESGAVFTTNDSRRLTFIGEFENNGVLCPKKDKTFNLCGTGVFRNNGTIVSSDANTTNTKIVLSQQVKFYEQEELQTQSRVYSDDINKKVTVSAGNVYYWGSEDGDWNEVANWYTDEELTVAAAAVPGAVTDNVVIPEGKICNLTNADKGVGNLIVRGSLVSAKKITTYGDLVIDGNGVLRSNAGDVSVFGTMTVGESGEYIQGSGTTYIRGKLYYDGTISNPNSKNINVYGEVIVNKDAKATTKLIIKEATKFTIKSGASLSLEAGSSFTINGDFIVKEDASIISFGAFNCTLSGNLFFEDNTTLTSSGAVTINDAANLSIASAAALNMGAGGTFKMKGDVYFEKNSQINIGGDVKFKMADNTSVNFLGNVEYTAVKSIYVGSYSNETINGNNIKVNFGENCSFVSPNFDSNFYAFSDMVDWPQESVYRNFTYTDGGKRLKLILRDRPSGELTFFFYYQGGKNTSWNTNYSWSLVDNYCIYINNYYPGKQIENADIAVVGLERIVTPNVSVQPTKITIDSEKNIKDFVKTANIAQPVPVYVKTRPQTTMTFYSEKTGEWSEPDMWTYNKDKHWYLMSKSDGDEYVNYVPDSKDDNIVVRNDNAVNMAFDKEVNIAEINGDATLSVPCDMLLTAKEINEVDNGKYVVIDNGNCKTWNDIVEKNNGVVTFWSVRSGEWSDSRIWSVTDPSILDGEGNPIITTYKGIYPGLDGQHDKVIISSNTSVELDGDYNVHSLEVRQDAGLSVAANHTLTVNDAEGSDDEDNGAITISGTMTIGKDVRLSLEGNGHFANSVGSIQTSAGSSYIRCGWTFLEKICSSEDGRCSFIDGEEALANYTSSTGNGTIELTSRPVNFSFAACINNTLWDANMAWTVVEGHRIFLYNGDFTRTVFPGESADGTDSFIIPASITVTHNLKLNTFGYAEIYGTLYLKDQALYPNSGTDLYLGDDGKYHPIVINTLRGSGIISEEYSYSTKVDNDSEYKASMGIYVIRKLDGYSDFYSMNDGDWTVSTNWADENNQSYLNRFPGSTNTPQDKAIVRHEIINSTTDVALEVLTIANGGYLKNGKSIRLIANDTDFKVEEGGKLEVTASSSLSFVGDGQNIVVDGEIIVDEGVIWSVVGNKNVIFAKCPDHEEIDDECENCAKAHNAKLTGKGAIRIAYDNIIQLVDGQPHAIFQSLLDANPKLDEFLAQGGIIEFTARPNDGSAMDFYLQNDGDWDTKNVQMWSIGDDEHCKHDDSTQNYHVYVYLAGQQRYYYPGFSDGSNDRVIITKGKTVEYTVAPAVSEIVVEGTLNVTKKNQTMNIVGAQHALNVGADGTINIGEGKTLTLVNGVKLNFETPSEDHVQLTGIGTLICYSSALDYTVNEDGVVTFTDEAVNHFVKNGGTLVLIDRPSELLTFFSIPTDVTWNNTGTPHWSLVEGGRAFVRESTLNKNYYYPKSGDTDNAVIISGSQIKNNANLTVRNLEVQDEGELIFTGSNNIVINGALRLYATGKLSSADGIVNAFCKVIGFDNIEYEGKDADMANIAAHKIYEDDVQKPYFSTIFANHIDSKTAIRITSRLDGDMYFYAQHNGQGWSTGNKFSILPDANVYLYLNSQCYYPGFMQGYTNDGVVIPEGKVVDEANISGVKSIGDLCVDGELLLYKSSDGSGKQLNTKGKILGSGVIRTGTSGSSILYVTSMNEECWKFTGTNELLDHETLSTGRIYVTGEAENITYYFVGTKDNSWTTWDNWRLNAELKRVYGYVGGRQTYPASHYDTDIAVIGVSGATRNDVDASDKLVNKKLNGLFVNEGSTLNITSQGLVLKDRFAGAGRIQSKYINGIICADDCADKSFYTSGVMFVTNNPGVFYTLKDMENGWGASVPSETNDWKTDTKYNDVNWSVVPNANVFYLNNNSYVVPSTNEEVHIIDGRTVNVFAAGQTGQSRTVKNLYLENGTLNICGGKLTVSNTYVFRGGEVHFCAPADELVLNLVDYRTEDDEAGLIKLVSDEGAGIISVSEEYYMTFSSWPKAFETYNGKVVITNINTPRKYFLKSGTKWSEAIWSTDESGKLEVKGYYPGKRFRDDEVVIAKANIDGVEVPQNLSHNDNYIVSSIDIKEGCSLTSDFDMTIDNTLTGEGVLTAKSLTIAGVDVIDTPVDADTNKRIHTLIEDGEVRLTGVQYANLPLYSPKEETADWSAIKWSLIPDGHIYYNKDANQKPGVSNDVIIQGDVTVNENASVKNLTIEAGATLRVCGGTITVNGSFRILGDLVICDDKTLVVNGKITEIADKADGEGNEISRITGDGTLQLLNTDYPIEIADKINAFESINEEKTNVNYKSVSKYRTKANGDWNDKAKWEIYTQNAETQEWEWIAASSVPASLAPDEVEILHNINAKGSYVVKSLKITNGNFNLGDKTLTVVGDLNGSEQAVITMDKILRLNVIGENKFFDDDADGAGEIRITAIDASVPFYAQNDGDWSTLKWAIDPLYKIYNYRNSKYDIPAITEDGKNLKIVINEGVTVNFDMPEDKSLNYLTVNGTLNVCNGKKLTVNKNIVIGANGNLSICDGSKVEAKLYIENAGNITGDGEIIVTELLRISGEGAKDIADNANKGKVLVTTVKTPVTYYSSESGDWNKTAKNDYVWSIVKGQSVVNYSSSKYNSPDDKSTIVITNGTVVELNGAKTVTNLTVEEGGILKVCGGTLTVNQDMVVDGKVILCEAATGSVKTKNITGHGDIIIPADKLTVTGSNEFAGRVGISSKDLTFYFKNADECDCSSDAESCKWENAFNWQVDANKDYLAYDTDLDKFYYPGEINDGRTYNAVVGNGKNVCLNSDININSLAVDGKVNVGELVVAAPATYGEVHDENTPVLNVETLSGSGEVTVEYPDNIEVNTLSMQTSSLHFNKYRKGVTYYLLESGGVWSDYYNWTTDPTASNRINPDNSYPGKTKKNDSAVIPSGRVVTLDENIRLDNITVNGEILVKDEDLSLVISHEAFGDGKMLVQDINKSFVIYDQQNNHFFCNGSITVNKPCQIPTQDFGSLIIDCNSSEAARLAGSIVIKNNLEVKSGSKFILGQDILTKTKENEQLTEMFKNGQPMPKEYDVFFNSTIGGDIIVEENAELSAARIIDAVRKILGEIGGTPKWNMLNIGGSFLVDGVVNFAVLKDEADNERPAQEGYYTPYRNIDNRARVRFFGSKNSEFIVNKKASVMSITCDKDEYATLYVNKAEDAQLYMSNRFCRPDSNRTEYPVVLNSGILRLGNHMKLTAWGATRYTSGNPACLMQYDLYVPESDVPIYHVGRWQNTNIIEAVNKTNNGEWSDQKNLYLKVKELGVDDRAWYINYKRDKQSFDAYEIFKRDLDAGMVIPAAATLWIDGAEVEVGMGDDDSQLLAPDGTRKLDGSKRSGDIWVGNVSLQGKLKITQGGKLILPKNSVGIVYDDPDGNINVPASISIEDGEIHTSRIYGLHGRKLDFNMQGGKLFFDVATNNNSSTYDDFYKTYGFGDITQGKAQGCLFSMANGGDFNMSGGLIKFSNYDNAQKHVINTLDLNNCGGQIIGGTIEIADSSAISPNSDISLFLGNHKLNNLIVRTKQNVIFHGNRRGDDPSRGFANGSLYINGDLTIKKSDKSVLVPQDLYVSGNIYVEQTDKDNMPIFGSQRGNVTPAAAPNLHITGDGDQWINIVADKESRVPLFNSLFVDKSDPNYFFTIKGRPLYLLGNLEVNKGQLITETQKIVDNRNGVVMGNLNEGNYVTQNQTIHVGVDGSIAGASLSLISNAPVNTDLKVLSDVVVKDFYSTVERRIFLGSYGFKVLNEFNMTKRSDKSMFVCTDENANGGLTVKAVLDAGQIIEMPVGVTYTNTSGGLSYAYARCKATAATAVDGYLTAIPCSNYHPSISNTEIATKFYWRMKWEGTEGNNIFKYDFRLPGVDQQGVLAKETQTKRCNDNTCSHKSHIGETGSYGDYTHYYQYYNLKWYDCDMQKLDCKFGDGCPVFSADRIKNPNGDFTDGYHFDTADPITYYSVSDGEWSSLSTWSLSESELVAPEYVPTVSDKVVIRNGNKITTENTASIKAAQIQFMSSESGMSTLTVAKTSIGNSVATIVGEGKLVYDVYFDSTRDWSINARLKEVNYLNGDISEFCDNSKSYIVYHNSTENEFYLPAVIRSYPNLVTEGKVTIKKESAPNGIDIRGNLEVNNGTLNISCAQDRKNHIFGNVVVKSGAELNVNNNIAVDGDVTNNGTISINNGTTELNANLNQNGSMAINAATLSFVGDKESAMSGNNISWSDGSLLVISKDNSSLSTYLESQLVVATTDELLNTTFTRGKIVFNNADNKISLAAVSNGSRMSYFDIPNTLSMEIESGAVTLWGTDVQSVKLDGSVVVSNGSLSTNNGFGYTSSGSASINLTNNASFSASQLAPSGESGKLNYSQSSSNVKVTLGNGGLYDSRYGRLDIRGGDFGMVKKSVIDIIEVADENVPTVYYTPSNSDINTGSSININIPQRDDEEHPSSIAYVYSEKPLEGMVVGEYTDVIDKGQPLTFNSALVINGSFISNGLDITVNGDMSINSNGKYIHGDNKTILGGTGTQNISGNASDVEFFILEKTGTASVNVSLSNPTVTKAMRVTNGVLSLTSPLRFIGDELFVNYGSTVANAGILMNGDSQQTLYCEGAISNLIVDNEAGINAATIQSHPITINNGLTLINGVLRIGSNQLLLASGAKIINGNDEPFGTSKMIATNLTLADMGIRKYVSSSSDDFMLPLGFGDVYAPVTVDISSLSSSNGYFDVKPINGYYMGVNNQVLDKEEGEYNNTPVKDHILDFNWYISTGNISNYAGIVTFEADGVHVNGYDHNHLSDDKGYVVAVYFDGKTMCDLANGDIDIENITDQHIKFSYSYDGDPSSTAPVAGYYLAGCYNALPSYPKSYISVNTDPADWTDEIWREYDMSDMSPKGDVRSLSSDEIYGSHIIIDSDVRLVKNYTLSDGTPSSDDGQRLSSVNITENGILRVGTTRSHYFGVVSGSGTLQIESGNMPSANYESFLNKLNGGTLEFTGSSDYNILYSFTHVRNLILSGSGKREFMSANNVKLDIYGDYVVDGVGLVAKSDADIRIQGNMTVRNGSFAGNGSYIFCGDKKQIVDVSGSELLLSGVEIANTSGLVEFVGGDDFNLKLSKRLVLTNGILKANAVTLTSYNTAFSGGSSTNYIDGWIYRDLNTGTRYDCFIGDGSRYGRSAMEVTSRGVWGIKYHDRALVDEGIDCYAKNSMGIHLSLNSEYWEVKRQSGTGTAFVTISWDKLSSYNGTQGSYQAFYSADVVPGLTSTWSEATTSAKSGTSSSGVATIKNGASGFNPGSASLFFAVGCKIPVMKQWLGINDNWFDINNWEGRKVPNSQQDVYINGDTFNPVINAQSDGRQAYANNIWLYGQDSHLTVNHGGKLIANGSIVVEDAENSHITIRHHHRNMSTVKLNDGYFETVVNGKRTNRNSYDKVRVELTMQKGRYNYIGSATVAGSLNSEKPTVLMKYDINNDSYTNVSDMGHDFAHAVVAGMSGSLSSEWTMVQEGEVMASGTKTFNVKGVAWSDGIYRWDLFANPFTFPVPLKDNSAIEYSQNIDPVIWFRSFNSQLSQFYFSTYSLELHVGVATGADAVSENAAYMAPQQAFFIRPLSGKGNGTITFYGDRANIGSINNSSMSLKSASLEPNDVLRLVVNSQGKNSDEVAFVFRDGGSRNRVYGDAEKMSLANTQNQIYGTKDGVMMVIPYYPSVEEVQDELIPLGVKLASSSNVGAITASNLFEFDDEYDVYLHDLLKNEVVNLRDVDEYSFDASEGSLSGRFAISLHHVSGPDYNQDEDDDEVATSDSVVSEDEVLICKCDDDHVLVIPAGDDQAVVTVYDIVGRVVTNEVKVSTPTRVALGEAKGVYLVEYISKHYSKTVKILK